MEMIDYATGEIVNIAEEINQEHDLFMGALVTGLDHAIRCGELLIKQKEQLEHGEWLPWVMANCNFTDRHARRYMKLASKRTRVSVLEDATSIREALRLLAEPKQKDDGEEYPISEYVADRNLAYAMIENAINESDAQWLKSNQCRFYFDTLKLNYQPIRDWAAQGCPTIQEFLRRMLKKQLEREG